MKERKVDKLHAISICHILTQNIIIFFLFFCKVTWSGLQDGRNCVNITCTQMGQQRWDSRASLL